MELELKCGVRLGMTGRAFNKPAPIIQTLNTVSKQLSSDHEDDWRSSPRPSLDASMLQEPALRLKFVSPKNHQVSPH